MNEIKTGKVLKANTANESDVFINAEILICEYNNKGAFGLVINQPTNYLLYQATNEFGVNANFTIYYGGPVSPNDIHFIHCRPDIIKNGISITENIFWNGNNEDVEIAIKNQTIATHELKFFHGYCGWDEGLLEEELQQKEWLLCNVSLTNLFG